MPPMPLPTFIPRRAPPPGGSQGDIYQIAETVKELNAIYQVHPCTLSIAPAVDTTLVAFVRGCVIAHLSSAAPARPIFPPPPCLPRHPPPPLAPPQLIARSYMQFTGMSADEIERSTTRDTFMTPEDATQVGGGRASAPAFPLAGPCSCAHAHADTHALNTPPTHTQTSARTPPSPPDGPHR